MNYKPVLFILGNIDYPKLPKEGDRFFNKHWYFSPDGNPRQMNLPMEQTIKRVIRLDICSNYCIAVTDEAYYVYPVRPHYSRTSIEKPIYFTFTDKIIPSGIFKDIKVYYVNPKSATASISSKTFKKTEYSISVERLYEEIYVAETTKQKLIIFKREKTNS